MSEERMDPKPNFVEELKALQKLNPEYAERHFALHEKQANHKMDIEKRTADHERKDSRERFWVIQIIRLIFAGLTAYAFYLDQIGVGYSLAGGVASSFLPQAYQNWLNNRKKASSDKNLHP